MLAMGTRDSGLECKVNKWVHEQADTQAVLSSHLSVLKQRRNHNVGEEHHPLELLGGLQPVPLAPAPADELDEGLASHCVQDLLGQPFWDAQLLLGTLHIVPVIEAEAVNAGIDSIFNHLQRQGKEVSREDASLMPEMNLMQLITMWNESSLHEFLLSDCWKHASWRSGLDQSGVIFGTM